MVNGRLGHLLDVVKMKTEPNHAMETIPVNVTIPAKAGLASFTSAAVMRGVKSSVKVNFTYKVRSVG